MAVVISLMPLIAVPSPLLPWRKNGLFRSLSERDRGLDTVRHFACGDAPLRNTLVGLQLGLSVLLSRRCNLVYFKYTARHCHLICVKL